MLSIICYVVAGILFLFAGRTRHCSASTSGRIAWGLFFCVVAWLLGGVGPTAPWQRA